MLTYVFPGQGSQFKGMGKELLDDFKTLSDIADNVLGYSLRELCVDDPLNQLNKTQFTQPAIYVVSALSYLKWYEESSQKADYLAGHSLGEYNALFAAGVFDFETGLKLVKKRGELMGRASAGGMAAVLGISVQEINNILRDNNFTKIDVANFNSSTQTVLSGDLSEINAAAKIFERNKARYIVLPVSAAFHSRYMTEAKAEFELFLKGVPFNKLAAPVISNVTARPHTSDSLKVYMADQITNSVRWLDTVHYLLDQCVFEFKELGPGNVLTKLVDSIKLTHKNVDSILN